MREKQKGGEKERRGGERERMTEGLTDKEV